MRVETFNVALAHSGVDNIVKLFLLNPNWSYKFMAPTVTTVEQYYRVWTESDFSTAPAMNQGSQLNIEEFSTPFTKDFTPIKRGIIAQHSKEIVQSDVYNIIGRTTKKLLNSIGKAMEVEAAGIVSLATSPAAADLGPDGKPLASATHPLESGTDTNILPSNPVLSMANLELARNTLMIQKSHKGDPMQFTGPFDLFVPPALMSAAERYAGSSTYQPTAGGAKSGEPNVMGDNRVRILMNPWFSSTTAWMLRTRDEDEHGQRFITRTSPSTDVWQDKDTQSIKISADAMFCKAIKDYRGCLFSDGTGS